jgi:putative effector of murein hydrolase LrgA (UPF0299 family)
MIKGLATLLGFQLIGEFVTQLAQLPMSGPICGMAALLIWLLLKSEVGGEVGKVCDGILANMALLFVPVGVGAMSYSSLFANNWAVIALAVVAGAIVTLITTALTTRALKAWAGRRDLSLQTPLRPIA